MNRRSAAAALAIAATTFGLPEGRGFIAVAASAQADKAFCGPRRIHPGVLGGRAPECGLPAGTPARAEAPSAGGCMFPGTARSYEDTQLTYGVDLDVTDCPWWRGTPITLDATVVRIEGEESTTADRMALCGDAVTDSGQPGTDQPRPGACAVSVSVDHPAGETAEYRGKATFPWEDGDHTYTFDVLCRPTTGCLDVPAGNGSDAG